MDLNIIIDDCGRRNSDKLIQEKICRCKDLGFATIALSVVTESIVPSPPKLENFFIPSGLKVYTRLTVKVSENLQIFNINKNPERAKYDLLAYEPQNLKLLQYISQGNAALDILTFDFTRKVDMSFFKAKYTDIVRKGVCIEINYGPAQLNTTYRRDIICQGQSIIEKLSSSVILSSGIDDIFRFRSPKDARSIGTIFLLSTNKSHAAVFRNGQKALDLAKCRSNPAASAISIVDD